MWLAAASGGRMASKVTFRGAIQPLGAAASPRIFYLIY